MNPDHRLWMVKREDRRHPGPEVIATRPIAGIAELRHKLVPALRDVSIVDTDLGWTRRKSISGQGGYDQVEIIEHRQHIHIIKETAWPAVSEDKRHPLARSCTLVHEVDAFPGEVVESVESPLPGTPVELMDPVGHDVL